MLSRSDPPSLFHRWVEWVWDKYLACQSMHCMFLLTFIWGINLAVLRSYCWLFGQEPGFAPDRVVWPYIVLELNLCCQLARQGALMNSILPLWPHSIFLIVFWKGGGTEGVLQAMHSETASGSHRLVPKELRYHKGRRMSRTLFIVANTLLCYHKGDDELYFED